MTDVKTFRDLVSNYNPQYLRETRFSGEEGIRAFADYIKQLQSDSVPLQVLWKSNHAPLSVSVIEPETERLLKVFVIEDIEIGQLINQTEGVLFYAY
jgi:hypothetical protein